MYTQMPILELVWVYKRPIRARARVRARARFTSTL